jgi:hypothetical protein
MDALHPAILSAEDGTPTFVVLPFWKYEALRARAALAMGDNDVPVTVEDMAHAKATLDALYADALASGPAEDMSIGFARRGL